MSLYRRKVARGSTSPGIRRKSLLEDTRGFDDRHPGGTYSPARGAETCFRMDWRALTPSWFGRVQYFGVEHAVKRGSENPPVIQITTGKDLVYDKLHRTDWFYQDLSRVRRLLKMSLAKWCSMITRLPTIGTLLRAGPGRRDPMRLAGL